MFFSNHLNSRPNNSGYWSARLNYTFPECTWRTGNFLGSFKGLTEKWILRHRDINFIFSILNSWNETFSHNSQIWHEFADVSVLPKTIEQPITFWINVFWPSRWRIIKKKSGWSDLITISFSIFSRMTVLAYQNNSEPRQINNNEMLLESFFMPCLSKLATCSQGFSIHNQRIKVICVFVPCLFGQP